MKFCTFKRNESGQITRVNKPDGSESKLFTKIARHPLVKTTEDAADIFKNIFTKEVKNRAKDTQEFFSSVVTGSNKKYIPSSSYKYDYKFTEKEEAFKEDYQPRLGDFDDHIATSIPTFRDIQVKKGSAIVEMYKDTGAVMYDLGGSEGGFAKSISSISGGAVETINLDANEDMINSHNAKPVEGSTAIREAFYEGFDNLPVHRPAKKADVVHESMLFQFITPERENFVDEIVDNYLKDGGIFITEEKFQTKNEREYKNNEYQKNREHKAKYYTQEQIDAKTDSVLVGMKENQAMFEDYLSLLRKKFKYVDTYWTAGNFKGIVASNDQAKVQEFLERLGDTTSAFSDNKPRDIQGINEKTGTLLLSTFENTDFVKNAGFDPKPETHITVITFKTGFIIKQAIEKDSSVKDAINELISNTDFNYTKTGQLFTITKEYEENKYQKAHTREAVVELIDMPGLKTFYSKLSEIVGQELDVPYPHITLGTKGNDMGIGVSSKAEFDSFNPTPIQIEGRETMDEVSLEDGMNERAFAEGIINGTNKVEDYENYDDYVATLETEKNHVKGKTLFVGSGGLPISSMLIKQSGIDVTSLDIDPIAVAQGKRVAPDIPAITADAATYDGYAKFNTIILALEAGTNEQQKEAILANIHKQVGPDTTILVRTNATPQKSGRDYPSAFQGIAKYISTQATLPIFGGLSNTVVGTKKDIEPVTNYPEDNIDFVHRLSNGKFANSYRDALLHSKEGDTIEIGLMIDGEFTPIVLARRNTNKNTEQGYINNQIMNGLISEDKTKVGLEYRFKVGGETELAQVLNMTMLKDDATAYLGFGGLKTDGSTLTINKTRGNLALMTKSGDVVNVKSEELDEMTYEEIKEKFDSHDEIIAMREWAASKVAYRDTEPVISQRTPVKSEGELQIRLLNFLNKLGVKTMSINEYVKKYRMKHGVNPSAKALADIANQVVAYTKGDVESLSEEVAHFINEAFPREQVSNILRNIHKTAEWAEFNEQYREIYSKEYTGEALEDVVRREVLGKIVAKIITRQVAAENSTELQRNIFERAADAISNFFTRVREFFKPEYDAELSQYLSEVEEMLSAEDISDYVNISNFKNSTIRLYNTTNTKSSADILKNYTKLLANQLQDTEKKLLTAGSGSKSNVKELQKIQSQLDDAVTVESIMSLVSMVNANVRALNAAIDSSEKNQKSYFLSDEEAIVYQNVKEISSKAIMELQALLTKIKKEEKTRKYDDVIKELESTSSNVSKLIGKASIIDSQNVQRLVDKIMDKYPIAAENRAMIEKWINKAESDTNLFHATFGQLVHAKDGLLNLAGTIIKDMHLFAHDRYLSSVKKYQDKLKELGVTESDIGKEFVDGQYILSEYDFNKFEQAMDIIYAQTYKEVVTEALTDPRTETSKLDIYKELSNMSIEELIALKKKNELEVLSLKEETSHKNKQRPLTKTLIERTMIDSYYDEYEEKLQKADISDITKQRLSDYLSDVSSIKKKAYRKEGDKTILDYDSLSEFDKERLSELHKSRKMAKSYVDEAGQLKAGLKYIIVDNKFQIDPETGEPLIGISSQAALSDEARIALDINKLDREFTKEKQENDAKLFYETLDKIDRTQGRESALKFLEANAYIGLSQEFWNNLTTGGGIVDKLERYKIQNPKDTQNVNIAIHNIKLLSYEIKSIIKFHNKKNNPAEVNVSLMSKTSIDAIKEAQKDLKNEIQRAKKIIGDESELSIREEGLLTGVSEVNQSYRDMLKDQNILEDPQYDTAEESLEKANQEVNFALEHMTVENANRIEGDRLSIGRYLTGSRANPSNAVQYALEELELTLSDLADMQVQADVLRLLARKNVLPYFKRYTSEGYTEFMDGLESAPRLADYLQNSSQVKNAFLEVNPNPTFFDIQENENLNPKYKQDFKGGYLQPKLDNITLPKDAKFDNLRGLLGDTFSFRNEKFEQKFGDINNGVSTKNDKLYQAYLATLEFNQEGLEAMNISGTHNQYVLPQIRKGKIQRFSTLLKGNIGGNARNFVKDALSYTEDDMIQGDTTYGTDIKVIPKMYINRLENPEDISTELFYSLALRAKEGFSRESKVKHYGDLMSIYDKISTREMNGKNPTASNTFRMMKSAIDYNLFGVKESATYPVRTPFGTIDLTKLARLLLGFVKFRNLGLNVVIPLTSLITGEVTRKMESTVGEFIDSRSQSLGTKEFRKLAPEGMKEVGKINTESKLNVLGQFFKAFDINDSFYNSNYNKFLRFMPRMGMMLHSAANYGIYGKTLLGVLHDFRVVDGTMMNRNDFIAKKKAEGVSRKDAITDWRRYEDKVMYKYLIHDKNDIKWDRDALKEDLLKDGEQLSEQALTDAIKDMYTRAQKHASLINSLIDGQIPEEDRVLAQRHYLLSYFMTHRGWLSIGIARRFKNRHLNLDTQLLEEGSYRSVYHYLGGLFREMQANNWYKFAKAFKATWNDPTNINEPGISDAERELRMKGAELVRRNMRRVLVEASILTGLMALSLILRGFADDDDNEDLFALQMANYMTYRTINELSSVQLNISSNMVEAIESPFVGMNTVKNLWDAGELFSGEEVKHGSYRGMSKRQRYLTKMVPGMKQAFDLANMNQTYETYKFYNTKNFSLTPANLLWLNYQE